MGKTIVKLKDVLDRGTSNLSANKLNDNEGDYPVYGATGLFKNVDFFQQDKEYLAIIKDGAGVGRVYHYPAKSSILGTMQYLFPKDNINIRFAYYYLKSLDFKKYTCGAAIPHIYYKDYCNETLALPSKEEQEKIVSILDKADEIRAKKKLANDKLDEFLKSTFISMFGDSKGNPNGFELKELQTISNVGSSKRVFVNELVEKGIPFYRGTEIGALAEGKEILPELFITEEHYKELCDCTGKVNQGDLLLPSICPDGRIWQVQNNTEFYFKDGRVLWIRPNAGENSTYIRYALKELFQSDYKHIASGTTFAELKIFILKTLNIMYPPMELQNKFAQIVEHVEAQKQKNELVIEQMNNLFNSLSQRAFKGEL